MPILRLTGLLLLSATCFAQQPALSGSADGCPDQGTRTFHSEIVQDRAAQAQILGTATHTANGCEVKAELRITRNGSTNVVVFEDPDKQDFSIIDFSPDGSSLLLASRIPREFASDENSQVAIAIFPLSKHNVVWHNTWDIFGWRNCDASVEPQGFDSHGNVIIRTQPSQATTKHRADCVADVSLSSVNLPDDVVQRLPDTTPPVHHAKQIASAR